MKLVPFSILTAFALIFAILTVAESGMYQAWEKAVFKQKDLQSRVVYYQRLNAFTEQVLRRLAVDSQRDPAIADLLKKHGIKVVISPAASINATPVPAAPGAAPAPDAADKPAPTPTTPAQP